MISPMEGTVKTLTAKTRRWALSDVAGKTLWLTAKLGKFTDTAGTTPATADNDQIARWEDQSGNARHFTQATAAARPILKTAQINGHPAIRFDGVDDWLSLTGVPQTTLIYSYFAVLRVQALTGVNRQIVHCGTTANGYGLSVNASNNRTITHHGVSLAVDGAATTNWEQWSVVRKVGEAIMFVNGVQRTIVSGGGSNVNTPATGMALGRIFGSTSPAQVDIAELMLFDRDVTPFDRSKIAQHLQIEWGGIS